MNRTRSPSESGLTLIELLITVMIMGVAFVALIGGMTSSFIGASVHRRQAIAETDMRRYAEAMKGAAYASTYASLPATFTVSTGFAADFPVVLSETCRPTTSTTNCTQIVQLGVHSTDNASTVAETIQIAKRK